MTVEENKTVERLADKVSAKYAKLKSAGVKNINYRKLLEEIIIPEVPADELRFYCSAVAIKIQKRRSDGKRETSLRINPNFINQHFAGLPRGDRD